MSGKFRSKSGSGSFNLRELDLESLGKVLEFDDDEGVMAQADAPEEGRSSDLKLCRFIFRKFF